MNYLVVDNRTGEIVFESDSEVEARKYFNNLDDKEHFSVEDEDGEFDDTISGQHDDDDIYGHDGLGYTSDSYSHHDFDDDEEDYLYGDEEDLLDKEDDGFSHHH